MRNFLVPRNAPTEVNVVGFVMNTDLEMRSSIAAAKTIAGVLRLEFSVISFVDAPCHVVLVADQSCTPEVDWYIVPSFAGGRNWKLPDAVKVEAVKAHFMQGGHEPWVTLPTRPA